MTSVAERVSRSGRGLLGTWVKVPALETMQLIGHAGFDFVVVDMEHAPHSLQRAVELVFCAQAMGMSALVRVPDHFGTTIQPLLDGGADGLLVPRVSDPATAAAITRRMVFGPEGERGLGATSRAGRWGLAPVSGYLKRGNEALRMIQLEDWDSLERAAEFAAVKHVGGIFIGHGDLYLSSGRLPSDPAVMDLTARVLATTRDAGILSGVSVGTSDEARAHLDMGFSLVMLSNDTTLFGNAVFAAADAVRQDGQRRHDAD